MRTTNARRRADCCATRRSTWASTACTGSSSRASARVAFIRGHVAAHRGKPPRGGGASVDRAVWAILGLGTMANIARELHLLDDGQRGKLLTEMGDLILDG